MISRNLEWSCQQNSGIELWKVNIILERKMNARNKHNCCYVSKNGYNNLQDYATSKIIFFKVDSDGKSHASRCCNIRMWQRRQYHILVERCLPSSNLKSNFSRLPERSAEVLALYSCFHSLLLLGGLLNNLGLSFRTRWTVRPYLAFEQGVSHVQEIV